MVIRKGHLGEPETDLTPVRGPAALSLQTQLTRESFSLAGVDTTSPARRPVLVRFVRRQR